MSDNPTVRDLAALDRALTPAERRVLFQLPARGENAGYAATPGGGPPGETCGSCSHLARKQMSRVYLKCGLMAAAWTNGGATDIRARSPACAHWERKPDQPLDPAS